MIFERKTEIITILEKAWGKPDMRNNEVVQRAWEGSHQTMTG